MELAAGSVQHRNAFARFEPQNIRRVMRLAAGQDQRVALALFGRQVKAVHETSQLNRLLAFSRKLFFMGWTLSSQSCANSSSLARWAAFKCVGISIKPPEP